MKQTGTAWFDRKYGQQEAPIIAYFSLEFGLTGITDYLCWWPFGGACGRPSQVLERSQCPVGRRGIALPTRVLQYLNQAGWQQEAYEDNHFDNLPLMLERGPDGEPLVVDVQLPGRKVFAQIWRVQVGRVPLYLLDTNTPLNSRPPGPRHHRSALRWGSRSARQTGDTAGYRRLSGTQGPGLAPRGLSHERGAFRIPGARAHSQADS